MCVFFVIFAHFFKSAKKINNKIINCIKMKKLSFITMMCAVVVLIGSCTSKTATAPKANLVTDIDSLSYAIGISQTGGLVQYLEKMNIDSTHINDFLKGFYEGISIQTDDVKKNAYITGLKIGQQLGGQQLEQFSQQIFGADAEEKINKDNFVAGFAAGATKDDKIMNDEEANKYLDAKLEELETKKMEKEFGANKDFGYAFLEENKTKEGVVTLPSGLQYKVIKAGKGAIPALTDRVKVHYVGTLIDGTKFDSSYDRNEPATFSLTGVIDGWTEALSMMPVGSKWMLYVPQELAYGKQQQRNIPPFSALIFEVELIEIIKEPANVQKIGF
jgi:FKBP-type peptidyl-prolyl cis-trans isomerase FklB